MYSWHGKFADSRIREISECFHSLVFQCSKYRKRSLTIFRNKAQNTIPAKMKTTLIVNYLLHTSWRCCLNNQLRFGLLSRAHCTVRLVCAVGLRCRCTSSLKMYLTPIIRIRSDAAPKWKLLAGRRKHSRTSGEHFHPLGYWWDYHSYHCIFFVWYHSLRYANLVHFGMKMPSTATGHGVEQNAPVSASSAIKAHVCNSRLSRERCLRLFTQLCNYVHP